MNLFKSWITTEKWDRLLKLKLSPVAKLELMRGTKSAYGISQWIEVQGEHGHWKGAVFKERHPVHYVDPPKSISRNARWYRLKRGYSPLVKGLYDEATTPVPLSLPPGIPLPRRAFVLKVTHAHEIGNHLNNMPFYGEPDLYLTGGVFYGKSPRKQVKLSLKTLYAKVEPRPPLEGEINLIFRDRVKQNALEINDPWEILVIADSDKLAANENTVSSYLNVGDEAPGPDNTADVSALPTDRGVLIHYEIDANRVILPDSGGSASQSGRGKSIIVRGDQKRRSVEVEFEVFEMPIDQ